MSLGSPPFGRPPLGGWILFISESVYETTPSMGQTTCFYIIIERFLALTSAANQHRKLNRGGLAILALHWRSVHCCSKQKANEPLVRFTFYLPEAGKCLLNCPEPVKTGMGCGRHSHHSRSASHGCERGEELHCPLQRAWP